MFHPNQQTDQLENRRRRRRRPLRYSTQCPSAAAAKCLYRAALLHSIIDKQRRRVIFLFHRALAKFICWFAFYRVRFRFLSFIPSTFFGTVNPDLTTFSGGVSLVCIDSIFSLLFSACRVDSDGAAGKNYPTSRELSCAVNFLFLDFGLYI